VRDFFLILSLFFSSELVSQRHFICTKNAIFSLQDKPYTFLGTNYWYGGYLAYDSVHNGYQRLCRELDFLKEHGVTNLRVLFSGEGNADYPYRVSPAVQENPGIYNDTILQSFDVFLTEAAKRNMKIICILSNNWEWSGGFGQYLEWTGYSNPILPKTPHWDWNQYCQYISQFYTCDSCQSLYKQWIAHIVKRKNTLSNILYSEDTTIMAWQLANEPRPMTLNTKSAYKNWIATTSQYIKSLDTNHLVSIGVEGIIGTAMDSFLFLEIHNLPSIDYATLHLWPKTWIWYNGQPIHSTTDTTLSKTKKYIELHTRLCHRINKPLVIEEFGLHRDDNSFSEKSKVNYRDKYYQFILHVGRENKVAGYNFWGAFAYRDQKLVSDFWKNGLPYSADPPQEEQGLYGVFLSDTSTWNLIKQNAKK